MRRFYTPQLRRKRYGENAELKANTSRYILIDKGKKYFNK